MPPSQFYQMTTERGDELLLTRVENEGEISFLLSVQDADETSIPTAELTSAELLRLQAMVARCALGLKEE